MTLVPSWFKKKKNFPKADCFIKVAVTHILFIRVTGPCWRCVAVGEDTHREAASPHTNTNRPVWCSFSSRSIFPSKSSSWAACSKNKQSCGTRELFPPDGRTRQRWLLHWVSSLRTEQREVSAVTYFYPICSSLLENHLLKEIKIKKISPFGLSCRGRVHIHTPFFFKYPKHSNI